MIFLDHIDTWCPYREQTALACWQWTFKRFFRGRIKAQWWVSEKNLEEAWFTYHSLKCPDDLAEGFTLRAAKRKVAHSHVTPLLIFQVVFPWLSENFLCHQHIRQACLWYAASNTAPGITLLLHYQTFWTFSLVSGGGGGGGGSCFESTKAKYALMWKAAFREAATRNVCFWNQWDQGLFLTPKVVGQLGHQFSGQEKELLLQTTLEKALITESDLWRNGSGHRASTSRSFQG